MGKTTEKTEEKTFGKRQKTLAYGLLTYNSVVVVIAELQQRLQAQESFIEHYG
jgi:hypothetical protein